MKLKKKLINIEKKSNEGTHSHGAPLGSSLEDAAIFEEELIEDDKSMLDHKRLEEVLAKLNMTKSGNAYQIVSEDIGVRQHV